MTAPFMLFGVFTLIYYAPFFVADRLQTRKSSPRSVRSQKGDTTGKVQAQGEFGQGTRA